nr:hypothetical protein [Mobiluncus sp. Marseille-Q7826]
MRNMSEMRLRLEGEPGTIPASEVGKMLERASDLVKSVEGGERSEPVVTNLCIGSAEAVLEIPDLAGTTIDTGLDMLVSRRKAPIGWTNRSLRTVDDLSKLRGGRGAKTGVSLNIGDLPERLITPEIGRIASQVKIEPDTALTQVNGVIYSYTHRTPDAPCQIKLRREGLPTVTVNLPESLANSARGLIEQPVEVTGVGTRSDDGMSIVLLEATSIEPDDYYWDGEPIDARELVGIWKGSANDSDSVSLVRAMRDAW